MRDVWVYVLANYWEGQTHKGTRQILCVHFIGHSFKVVLLPCVLLNLQQRLHTKRQHKDVRDCHHPLTRCCIQVSSGITIIIYSDWVSWPTLSFELNPVSTDGSVLVAATLMKDLMEKRLASMVERPWARQLWAMNPSLSSARQMASSPSFQFQLGMFKRWAWGERGGGR